MLIVQQKTCLDLELREKSITKPGKQKTLTRQNTTQAHKVR